VWHFDSGSGFSGFMEKESLSTNYQSLQANQVDMVSAPMFVRCKVATTVVMKVCLQECNGEQTGTYHRYGETY
jgi:hypothetical protein